MVEQMAPHLKDRWVFKTLKTETALGEDLASCMPLAREVQCLGQDVMSWENKGCVKCLMMLKR